MTAPVFSRADRIAGAILSPLCILAVVIARAWCEAQLRRERRALDAARKAHGMTPGARRSAAAALRLIRLPEVRRARSLAVKPRELR